MEKFDLIIIGGGPAGYLAAERSASRGLSVLLIEKSEVGGVCLNEGCVPSKTLLNSAKAFSYLAHAKQYGINLSGEFSVDQKAVIDKKNRVVRRLVGGIKLQLKNANVTVIKEEATIKGKSDEGFVVATTSGEYLANKLIIATGSAPVVPPINGLSEDISNGLVLTNREILSLTTIPASLVIIGGGVIGLEMAQYYVSVGSAVTVVEMLDKIAGNTDGEISGLLQKSLEKQGVKFYLNARVTAITPSGVEYVKDNETVVLPAEKVLLSIGRKPVTANLGLENIGVITERGAIVTNEQLRTNVDGVYACGDVNGKIMLAHTAYREAEVAVADIMGETDSINYNVIPSVIYTNPEVGSVGETEQTAEQKNIPYKVVKLPLTYSGRYVAEALDQTGICKLVIDASKNTLIGAHIIGSYASEFIVAVSNLIDLQIDIERIKKLVFPHPTVSEIVRETIFTL